MKMRSCTFQSEQAWDATVSENLKKTFMDFFQNLNNENLSVHGVLQSFTFPSDFKDEDANALALVTYETYNQNKCFLLGGDTSTGLGLVITVIALIK